jgi:hypothetical protein
MNQTVKIEGTTATLFIDGHEVATWETTKKSSIVEDVKNEKFDRLATIEKVANAKKVNNDLTSNDELTVDVIEVYAEGVYVKMHGVRYNTNVFISNDDKVIRKPHKSKLTHIENIYTYECV